MIILSYTNPEQQKDIQYHVPCAQEYNALVKGRLLATIFESAETVHLILLCYFGDSLRWAVSAEKKMVARNHPWTLVKHA